eukprot:4012666-Prymnesium_polylepis.1
MLALVALSTVGTSRQLKDKANKDKSKDKNKGAADAQMPPSGWEDTAWQDTAWGEIVGWKDARKDLGAVNASEAAPPLPKKFDEVLDDPDLKPIDFRAGGGLLYGNHQPFHIKGINWYGSESRNGPPGGLDYHSVSWYMEFLAAHEFNALRLLFNHFSLLESVDPDDFPPLETDGLRHTPELEGKSYLEMFAVLAAEAARQGLLVMMACHRLSPRAWPGSGLWCAACPWPVWALRAPPSALRPSPSSPPGAVGSALQRSRFLPSSRPAAGTTTSSPKRMSSTRGASSQRDFAANGMCSP